MKHHRKKTGFASYRGLDGVIYHETKHGGGTFFDEVVARSRAQKLQPFVKETDAVFEYGVGTGYNLIKLRCQDKVGYDVAEYCRAKVEPRGINFISDMDEVLERQGQFDVVICHHVLEHVPEPTVILSRIRRLLKQQGRLLLWVPFDKGRRFRKFNPSDPDMHLYSWNPLSICNLLLYASYKIDKVEVCPFGYERVLAPLAKLGFRCYRMSLWAARLVRPVYEICVVARKVSTQEKPV